MNWMYNLYFAEGLGISKDAPKPEGLRLLAHVVGREWWELIKLNLLFIAFSLPLVTLPAAWLATVSICLAMIEDRNVYLLRDFWSAFRSRFMAATTLGLVLCVGAALSLHALLAYAEAAKGDLLFVAPLAVAAAVSVLVPLWGTHAFVAVARGRDQSLADIAKAAAIGMIARPLPGLAALAFAALLWLAHVLFYPASVLLPVLVNFSLGALLTSFAALKGIGFGFSRIASAPSQGAAGRTEMQSGMNVKEWRTK